MRDVTPTNPKPIDVLAAQLESYRKYPDDEDLFAELYEALRDKGQPEAVAEVAELRAPHESDPRKAAMLWAEAGAARMLVGDHERGERDLRAALALDPGSERANARLSERLMVAERYAEAAEVMENELVELDRRAAATTHEGDHEPLAARRGQRHRMLAELWDSELGRVDRALSHWQAAWKLEPERGEAIEAARKIYRALGQDDMVARLYRAELDSLEGNGASKQRGALHLELGRILARRGEHSLAADELEKAVALAPESLEAREALAEVYAAPEFAGSDEQKKRASELFVELGRSRLGTDDHDSAIGYLRRALGVDPYSRAGTENLEEALSLDERWNELERLFRHQEALATDEEALVATLTKRAALYDTHLDDRGALKQCLEAIAARQPAFGDADMRLRELYREDQQWDALAALMERDLEALGDDPPRLAAELLELATVAREHLNDRDRAAEHLHRALSVDPDNEEALARYSDHFRERRDWRGLADLTEFAIESGRQAGSPTSHIVRQLEELAQLAELRLGDVDRAVEAWRRVQNIEGDNPKAREALRRLASRAKMWEQLVGVLEQEAAAADGSQQRAEALRRMAQVYRERQVNPRRAIELYEEVLTVFPEDEASIKALTELYEREGDDAGLARSLRRQLDIDAARVANKAAAEGKDRPGARDWPVAQRVERLTTLRRLATMYEQRLDDVEGVVFACGGVLEILPGDRDALERMERSLEKSGDAQRLEQTLEYHAESATGPAERAKVLRRLARLAGDRADDVAAMERWERVLKAARNDQQALTELATLYERHGRWDDLAQVLERFLAGKANPPAGTPEAAARSLDIRRLAKVLDEQLERPDKAVRAWKQLLELLPYDREALDALARLHEAAGQWRDLAAIYERQAPLYLEDDRQKAADVALARAQLLEGRLGAPLEASKALEVLLDEVEPANLPAHKALRRLYEARGDFDAAVRIAEREMFLASEDGERVARGLEIGYLCRDQLGQPTRALQAFERVLDIDRDHDEALTAAADLYAQVGDWKRHVQLLERRVDRAEAGDEQRSLLTRIASATADKLGEPRRAFDWYRAAHDHAPDASTIAELRRAAEAHGLWAELAEVYEAERTKLSDPSASAPGHPVVPHDPAGFVSACRQLAAIAERRLDDRERAMEVLREALVVSPRDRDLVADAERIALEGDDEALWRKLVDCLEVSLPTANSDGKVALHSRRAQVFEERLDDAKAAVDELLRAFSWAPDRDETRQGLYGLAERTRRWSDVVAVEAALFERAPTLEAAVAVLRRKAQIIEENLHQRARAFRTHLQAFLLAPEDNETVAHLWRLAKEIEAYKPADKTATSEPPPAHVESPEAIATAGSGQAAPAMRPLTIESTKPRREDTQELSVSDLMADEPGAAPAKRRHESTIELDISDLAEARRPRNDPTIELRVEDLLSSLRPPPTPGGRAPAPPPTPRRSMPGVAPASESRLPQRPGPARLALVSMVSRSYDSPWEEFAAAYELLPARTTESRLRWTFRAAEIWESGAEDLDRAFDTLQRALDLAPDDPEPRARLHRLAAEHGKWDSLADLYLGAADNANNPDSAAQLLMDVAAIRVEQQNPRETEALYRRVLGMQPEHEVARAKLQDLYREEKRWVDLAALLEERTDPRLGSAAPEAERPALLRELAAIYRDELGRPHDALDALARLRDLDPEDLDILGQIADINRGMGRWSQVIDALFRVADIAEGQAEARDALRTIGEIYETEVELPDRAIDAYRSLVEAWPDDVRGYEALDRLYREHARWEDLSDTLRRRAALTEAPAERAQLLQRRARVLIEWLDRPDEAASALRHARTIAPDDGSLAEDLVEALVLCGREREASSVLEGRLQTLDAVGAPAGDRAALLIRLGNLRAEQIGDKEGAREALDRALELVPNHPTALAALARLAGDDDPRGYAEAKLREADAVDDIDAKITALIDAGSALRDGCRDIDGARGAFEKVLELAPGHHEATWALAGLVETSGDLDEASRLLESQLEREDLDDDDRARIHTQLAALARAAGVDAAAERRFEEALGVAPTHLPAIMGKADLLEDLGRHVELELFLQAIIPELATAPADTRAELDRRLALAYEAQGRDDDAYQTLLEADRLHRKNLRVKLALGENRYRARRWREAALHLAALADYPDAPSRAGEVADGLYHAALAEIRSLRPDKAEPLYRRALEFKPNHGQALHALAELAMERGQIEEAADLLTRQATASEDPAERVRLFEALGDLAVSALDDDARARLCFESAVNAADPLESRHLPLLEKLLDRQHRARDYAGAGRTAELMASFGDAKERAEHFSSAARNYLSAGDSERATAAATRAVETDPDDLESAAVVSGLLLDAGEHDRVADILGRALSGKEPNDAVEAAQLALLWQRLGAARQARGDSKGAVTAYEKALGLSADSDGAHGARRGLVELWRDDGDKRDVALEYARTVAAADREPRDVLTLGRLLSRDAGAGPVHTDGGRVALELASALGENLAPSDVEFLARYPDRPMADDDNYKAAISEVDRVRLLADGGDEPLASALAALWEAAPLLWSEPEEALARAGVAGAERVPSKTTQPAAVMFPHIAKSLAIPATMLYRTDAEDAPDVQVVCVSPPLVVLGPRLAENAAEAPSDLELRFLLARACELARPRRVIAAGLPPSDFAALLGSVKRVFAGGGEAAGEAQRDQDQLLRKTLPVKVRRELGELLSDAAPHEVDAERYVAACERAADRAGLLLCGDAATAIRMVGGKERAGHLIGLALDEHYLDVRARLGLG